MAEKLGIYKCEVCGNIVLVMHSGKGVLVCCGQPMKLQVAGSVDAATEKHVPVIEKRGNEYKVKVGSTPHPMSEGIILSGLSFMQMKTEFTSNF